MLGSRYVIIGIDRASNPNSQYRTYWTTDFGGVTDQAATLCGGSTPPPPRCDSPSSATANRRTRTAPARPTIAAPRRPGAPPPARRARPGPSSTSARASHRRDLLAVQPDRLCRPIHDPGLQQRLDLADAGHARQRAGGRLAGAGHGGHRPLRPLQLQQPEPGQPRRLPERSPASTAPPPPSPAAAPRPLKTPAKQTRPQCRRCPLKTPALASPAATRGTGSGRARMEDAAATASGGNAGATVATA